MAHRSFAEISDGDENVEDITFDLAGEKNFMCRSEVNGKLLMELVAKVDSNNTERQVEGIIEVFDITVLVDDGDNPEQYTGKWPVKHTETELEVAELNEIEAGVDPTSSLGRLTTLLNDPGTRIKIDELAELVGWLVEQYVGRPTGSASRSQRGVSNMRDTSRRGRRTRARGSVVLEQTGSSTSSTDLSSSSA